MHCCRAVATHEQQTSKKSRPAKIHYAVAYPSNHELIPRIMELAVGGRAAQLYTATNSTINRRAPYVGLKLQQTQ
jgi:hypothetical protein